jgi:branched-chain amino acid transport system substrate-binding protein
VQDYIAKYGGTASDINADVAEAYSAGQVMADAVQAAGLNQSKIIHFLHGATLSTVQGPAKFNNVGMNTAAATFIFQWQPGTRFVQVLPARAAESSPIIPNKASWTSG